MICEIRVFVTFVVGKNNIDTRVFLSIPLHVYTHTWNGHRAPNKQKINAPEADEGEGLRPVVVHALGDQGRLPRALGPAARAARGATTLAAAAALVAAAAQAVRFVSCGM